MKYSLCVKCTPMLKRYSYFEIDGKEYVLSLKEVHSGRHWSEVDAQ